MPVLDTVFIDTKSTNVLSKTEYQTVKMEGILMKEWSIYDDAAIITLYKQYLDLRDMSILGFAAAYLLQVLDANIEANFVHFDVSKI